jgi:putative DNA primase/helicase
MLIDEARPLEQASFPNPPRIGSYFLPATIQNVLHLLKAYGIIVRYNVIKKKLHITIPGYLGSPDNADNVAMAHIISLANLNGMAIGQIPIFVEVIADRHQVNPVADWITSKPWDGEDRLEAFYATLVEREGYPEPLKQVLMHRWLVSAVAAAFKPSGFRARGILTLQGPQSIGKSAWVNALVPDPILREQLVKLDQHLDAGNKDSILTAISHWIIEIGELDGAFKKDIARLKGFLTGDRDKIRRPYGRTDSEYPRRTVFCATVNDDNFLVDATGNTRWWTIPVTKVNYTHGIDMQQLFAQVLADYKNGMEWWLTKAEEGCLETFNQSHRSISAIRERVLDVINIDKAGEPNLPALTPTALLNCIGIKNPTNGQCKECGLVLRELLGEPKRIRGQNKWRIPFTNPEFYTLPTGSSVSAEEVNVY